MNEYDSDYEKKKIDKMDKEITERLKNHKEYLINTGGETKEQKKERKKLAKGKRNLEIQAEFANRLELKKYSNKEIEDSGSDNSDAESSEEDFTDISTFAFLYQNTAFANFVLQRTSAIRELKSLKLRNS